MQHWLIKPRFWWYWSLLDDYLNRVPVDGEFAGNRPLTIAGEPSEGINVKSHVLVDWSWDDALCSEGGAVASRCILTRWWIAASWIQKPKFINSTGASFVGDFCEAINVDGEISGALADWIASSFDLDFDLLNSCLVGIAFNHNCKAKWERKDKDNELWISKHSD